MAKCATGMYSVNNWSRDLTEDVVLVLMERKKGWASRAFISWWGSFALSVLSSQIVACGALLAWTKRNLHLIAAE